MKETYDFLKKLEVNYLATINGNKPSCRPFGDPVLFDEKIYILTKKHKEVFKQISANNHVCIVAYDNENWIRIHCDLINDSENIAAKQAIIQEFDWAEKEGYTLENPDFQIFYLANANSIIYDEESNPKEHFTF